MGKLQRTTLLGGVLVIALAACGQEGETVAGATSALTQTVSPSPSPVDEVTLSSSPVPTLLAQTPTPTPEAFTFLNLRVMHATVENFVIDMFQGVFADGPTSEELEDWTSYIIRIGNRLQRDRGLSFEDALSEAMARAFNEFMSDPFVQRTIENQQENEAMHDAMEDALEAIRCLADPDC